jgi:hypothetical protein
MKKRIISQKNKGFIIILLDVLFVGFLIVLTTITLLQDGLSLASIRDAFLGGVYKLFLR